MFAVVLSLPDTVAPRNQQVAAASRRTYRAAATTASAAPLEKGQGRSDPGLISYRPSLRSLKQERAAGEVRSGEWGGSPVTVAGE